MIFNNLQIEIANRIDNNTKTSNWKDWRWQLSHSIKSLDKFEELTGIRFEQKERNDLKQTFEKFPLSITPYYLSLIDRNNFRFHGLPIRLFYETTRELLQHTKNLIVTNLKYATEIAKTVI